MRNCVVGVDLDRTIDGRESVIGSAQLEQRDGAVRVRSCVVGVDLEGAVIRREGLLVPAQLVKRCAPVNSGPVVGPEVVAAVSVPVIGGFGGGPWLDGRVRMAHAAIGYAARHLDEDIETYANVASITFDAITAFSEDVRAARQIKGGSPIKK